jgi:hypothetical protein
MYKIPKKNRPEPEAVSGKIGEFTTTSCVFMRATHEMKYAAQGIGGKYENS